MKKLIGSALAAGVIAASALTGVSPAMAADTQCASGRYCYWNNTIYSGGFGSKAGSSGNMGIASDNVTNMNDISTSHWNRFGATVKIYEDVSYTGRNANYSNGSKISNLSDTATNLPFPLTWNDRISSFAKL